MFFLVREITGSNKAAIITSFLFTFSELYCEIMCWGGIPNLFGIFFMLFSICYFIKSIEDDSWKNVVLAGVLFSFTIGTHHLTAVYYVIVLLISIPLFIVLKTVKLRSMGRIFLLLMVVTIPLSLPYMHVYAFLFPQRVNVATSFMPSVELYYSSLWNSFSIVTREWPAIFALNAVVLASVINLWSRHKAKAVTGIISSLAISVLVLAFMLHPSLMARTFYFVHIPIFLAFGVLLSDIFARLHGTKVFFQDPWETLSLLQNNGTLSVSQEKILENVTQTKSSVAITYKYSCDLAVLVRRVEVSCSPQTDVFYDFELTDASISEFEIPICVFPKNRIDNYVINDGEVVLNLVAPSGEVGGIRISVVETNSKSVDVTFAAYPIKEQPTFVFALHTEGSELFAHFRVLCDLEIGSTDGVEYLMAQGLLEIYNITHVLLDKRRVLDSYRFTCETDKYEVVFENDAVLIVKVEK